MSQGNWVLHKLAGQFEGRGLEKCGSEARADAGNCQTRAHSMSPSSSTSSTMAPSVNTGTVKADVATMNLETNDSTISKFLRGTLSDVLIHLFPAAGGDVFSKNTVINNITSASRKHKIIFARFS